MLRRTPPKQQELIQKLTLNDFKFRANFTEDLNEGMVVSALLSVNAQFTGVYTLWSSLPEKEAKAKRELCINYLIAWKLMMLYPDLVLYGSGVGGIPVSSKRAGPISIHYRDLVRQSGTGILDLLTTNQYGLEALLMIESAPEMYQVFA